MDPLAPLIQNFHAEGRPRVWSLVITIFGDAVQHRGGRISGVRLQTLLERIGIESGAMRTALSRLAHDGWITRERQGRNSCYQLSPKGIAEFAPATQRIYGAPHTAKITRWTLASGGNPPVNGIRAGVDLWLVPNGTAAGYLCVTGELGPLPEAFYQTVLSPDHRAAFELLVQDIETVLGLALEPLEAMTARILIIHRWRRIVLRFPDLPREVLPPEFRTPTPHQKIAVAYGQLADQAECWLDAGHGKLAPMPPASAEFLKRFQT